MNETRSARLRVLVVDDCPDTCSSLAYLLEWWGCEARVAGDGPAGLAAAASFRPDVVLLDIGLPGMDGWKVAEAMRRQPGAEAIYLVAMTGHAREQDLHHSRAVGCDRHLVKPFDPAELERLLKERGQLACACGGPQPPG